VVSATPGGVAHFGAGFVACEHPFEGCGGVIALSFPGRDFTDETLWVVDSTDQAAAAAEDYAQCMRELTDIHYPDAECIRVVQDNLSTHSAGALYEAFAPAEARRILRRLAFHYTPKHASWLNTVAIEIGGTRGPCPGRRTN